MREEATAAIGYARLGRLALALTVAVFAAIALRWGICGPPKMIPSPAWAKALERDASPLAGSLLMLLPIVHVVFVIAVPILLLRLFRITLPLGAEASRRIPVSAAEAGRIADRGLAQLILHGHVLHEREPLPPDGWKVGASLRLYPRMSDDSRRMPQAVEFLFSNGTLQVTHRAGGPLSLPDGTDAHYQRWVLDALAQGESIDHPPLRLNLMSLYILAAGVFLAACGALTPAFPAEIRAYWVLAQIFSAGLATFLITPMIMFLGADTKWTVGRLLVVPGMLLFAAGLLLALLGM